MAVEKLKIAVEDNSHKFPNSKAITVLYNPNRITIQKSGWQVSGSSSTPTPNKTPASLTVELFCDTSAPDEHGATDVRKHTQKIYNLTNARGALHRPPICRLVWGGERNLKAFNGSVLFQGLLQQVTKTFTHFTAQGMPVRATLNCTFLEWEDPEQQKKKLNPIDDPIRIVKQGETLSSIATEEYGDPALWRVIANVNRLNNPRKLTPGFQLTVPPLPSQGGA